MMFKKLAQKLNSAKKKSISTGASINPIDIDFDERKSVFLDKLTKSAVHLYEREQDIKKFSHLVMSDPENKSADDIVDKLFQKGIVDPLEDEKLMDLADNKKFLKDLGLS